MPLETIPEETIPGETILAETIPIPIPSIPASAPTLQFLPVARLLHVAAARPAPALETAAAAAAAAVAAAAAPAVAVVVVAGAAAAAVEGTQCVGRSLGCCCLQQAVERLKTRRQQKKYVYVYVCFGASFGACFIAFVCSLFIINSVLLYLYTYSSLLLYSLCLRLCLYCCCLLASRLLAFHLFFYVSSAASSP